MASGLCSLMRGMFLQQNTRVLNSTASQVFSGTRWFLGHAHAAPSRCISTSPYLMAEPLKKKKRMDPAIIKAREDRRKKKIEKQIRRLQKHERQLKPLDELEVPFAIVDNPKERMRPALKISPQEEEYRWLHEKKWSRYRFAVHAREIRMIDRILCSQEKALNELKKESEELYNAAIQIDFSYVPYEIKGPVETPPVKGYDPTEGDYIDISQKWE